MRFRLTATAKRSILTATFLAVGVLSLAGAVKVFADSVPSVQDCVLQVCPSGTPTASPTADPSPTVSPTPIPTGGCFAPGGWVPGCPNPNPSLSPSPVLHADCLDADTNLGPCGGFQLVTFLDSNRNGNQDSGESRVAGIQFSGTVSDGSMSKGLQPFATNQFGSYVQFFPGVTGSVTVSGQGQQFTTASTQTAPISPNSQAILRFGIASSTKPTHPAKPSPHGSSHHGGPSHGFTGSGQTGGGTSESAVDFDKTGGVPSGEVKGASSLPGTGISGLLLLLSMALFAGAYYAGRELVTKK